MDIICVSNNECVSVIVFVKIAPLVRDAVNVFYL